MNSEQVCGRIHQHWQFKLLGANVDFGDPHFGLWVQDVIKDVTAIISLLQSDLLFDLVNNFAICILLRKDASYRVNIIEHI